MPQRRKITPLTLRLIRFVFRFLSYVFPWLGTRLAFYIWFRPTFARRSVWKEMRLPEDSEPFLLEYEDKQVRGYLVGHEGPVVLLVHGWGSTGRQMDSFVAPLRKLGKRVLIFDFLAHGTSSGFRTDLPEMGESILRMHEKFGPFEGVIAHSFGATCVTYGLNQGLICKRLVYLSPQIHLRDMVARIGAFLRYSGKIEAGVAQGLEDEFGKKIWTEFSTDFGAEKCPIPLLVIHDEQDEDAPWQDGEQIARKWMSGKFMRTTGLGHIRILRDPSVIQSAVDFLK